MWDLQTSELTVAFVPNSRQMILTESVHGSIDDQTIRGGFTITLVHCRKRMLITDKTERQFSLVTALKYSYGLYRHLVSRFWKYWRFQHVLYNGTTYKLYIWIQLKFNAHYVSSVELIDLIFYNTINKLHLVAYNSTEH